MNCLNNNVETEHENKVDTDKQLNCVFLHHHLHIFHAAAPPAGQTSLEAETHGSERCSADLWMKPRDADLTAVTV